MSRPHSQTSKTRSSRVPSEPDHPFTAERRQRYAAAEAVSPEARAPELASFSRVLADGQDRPLLELGSGNGTLTKHLMARDWVVDTVDVAFSPVAGARRHFAHDLSQGLPPIPLEAPYAAVASLATLHHVVAEPGRLPERLAQGIAAVTAPGATVMLQDVPARAAVERRSAEPGAKEARAAARFFTGVVDRLSRPPHSGIYLEMDRIAEQLAQFGFETISVGWHACSWQFGDYGELADFAEALFNLHTERDRLDRLLEDQWRETDTGVEMLWALDCLVMRKA